MRMMLTWHSFLRLLVSFPHVRPIGTTHVLLPLDDVVSADAMHNISGIPAGDQVSSGFNIGIDTSHFLGEVVLSMEIYPNHFL